MSVLSWFVLSKNKMGCRSCREQKKKQEEAPIRVLVTRVSSRKERSTLNTEEIKQRDSEIQAMRARLNARVYVQESTLLKAGRGLFAAERIAAGQPICEYVGDCITFQDARKRRLEGKATHIRSLISMAWCIDGINTDTGGAMANDAGPDRENAEMISFHATDNLFHRNPRHSLVYLRALCTIEAGEEIFVDYGEDYEWPYAVD